MALTFSGPYGGGVNTSGGGGQAGMIAAGTTRWNQTDSCFEVFDGHQWVKMGDVKTETMQDMVQHAEDRVATTIVAEYEDNATIQDAYKEWEAANERFMVVLALAEKPG